ncbi:quercetin 2,3-dioxygenase [Aquipuribacter sp. SD81]|uniref:quercetin 2,3-dioxygenase n=1 Tax=Aquipuribacter sp. SD81 TaxID=3127703 RepID=UPI00301929A2
MTTHEVDTPAPFGLGPQDGEARWFLGQLMTFKATTESTGGRMALIEGRAAQGPASPLHVHRREAEWWYVLEGELVVWAGGSVIEAPAGSFVYGPPDVPHTFSVVSDEARFLLGTEPAGFEQLMRLCSETAGSPTLPAPEGAYAPDPALLTELAAHHGIEILGPPGLPA